MITATLTRIPQPSQMLGKLIVRENNAVIFECDTIELPYLNNKPQVSCIPKGAYQVVYRESAKYPRQVELTRSNATLKQMLAVIGKKPFTLTIL